MMMTALSMQHISGYEVEERRALEKFTTQICKGAHLADCTKQPAAVVW